MEKISSIVKGSQKSTVDLSKERPVRAGAPTFGQPISKATQTFEKVVKENEILNKNFAPLQETRQEKENLMRHTDIVDRVTLSFHKKPEVLVQSEMENLNLQPTEAVADEEVKEKIISIYV